jgi:malyl-CoA/(S)-citramalyl-CoA lyase
LSHTNYPPVRTRLQRSELCLPCSQPKFFAKAIASDADYLMFDLEDAVAPDDKDQARLNLIQALHDYDFRGSGKAVSVRINGLDTHYMYRDVIDVVEQAGRFVDTILVPKVGVPSDIYVVDVLLTQIEQAKGLMNRIGIEALIESALGLAHVVAIAQSSPRLEAMHFGPADMAASMKARTVSIGGLNPHYPGDQWHMGLARIAVACRAYGLRAIDGPFGNISDPDDYVDAARRAAALGYDGKWAIHPSQISLANDVFSPSEEETTHARNILAALAVAEAAGAGAAQLEGKMIDAASARMAENVVQLADEVEKRSRNRGQPAIAGAKPGNS